MALNLAENLIEDAWQLHHQLALQLEDAVSKLLNAKVTLECTNVEKVRWSDFLEGLTDPVLLCGVNMPPLGGQLLIEIHQSVALQIVAQLLNYASSQDETLVTRPLTDVERISMMEFVNLVLAAFAVEWKQVYPKVDVQFSSLANSSAKLAKSYPKGTTLLIDLELRVEHQISGRLRFCYPPDLLYAIQSLPSPMKRSDDSTVSARRSFPAAQPGNAELLAAIEDLLEIYTRRIEQRIGMLEEKVDALSRKRGRRH